METFNCSPISPAFQLETSDSNQIQERGIQTTSNNNCKDPQSKSMIIVVKTTSQVHLAFSAN